MRAFRFRLERLLNLRQAEKQQRAIELAERRREFDAAQQELRLQLKERDRITNAYRHLVRHVTAAWSWNSARDAMRASEVRVANQAKATKAALDAVEEARERLVEISGEVERYIRLREKQREAHDLAARRAEQKVHDDTSVDRYLQQQQGRGHGRAEVLTG